MIGKCIDCENLTIDVDKPSGYAAARCVIKNPPKKGKIITWACTTFKTRADAIIGKCIESGGDSVLRVMRKKKKEPAWCPLVKNND